MILVVSPGPWGHRFTELDHAAWNGWTVADIVMAMFLFCVGIALGMKAFDSKRSQFNLVKVFKRSCLLIIVGLLLSWIESGNLNTIRIPGILQRIAVCYFLASFLLYAFYKEQSYGVGAIAGFCLICFTNYLLMNGLSIGAAASGELTYKSNLAAEIDRSLFGIHHLLVWGRDDSGAVVYDPEGLLSTMFATANVLAGALLFFFRKKVYDANYLNYTLVLLGVATAFLAIAYLLNQHGVLINKKLWSLSFTLLSIGLCIFMLMILDIALAKRGPFNHSRSLSPLTVFGSNAILAFVISSLMLIFSGTPVISVEAGDIGIQPYIFSLVSQIVSGPYLASLVCAVLVCLFIYILLLPLHLKQIYLRL